MMKKTAMNFLSGIVAIAMTVVVLLTMPRGSIGFASIALAILGVAIPVTSGCLRLLGVHQYGTKMKQIANYVQIIISIFFCLLWQDNHMYISLAIANAGIVLLTHVVESRSRLEDTLLEMCFASAIFALGLGGSYYITCFLTFAILGSHALYVIADRGSVAEQATRINKAVFVVVGTGATVIEVLAMISAQVPVLVVLLMAITTALYLNLCLVRLHGIDLAEVLSNVRCRRSARTQF